MSRETPHTNRFAAVDIGSNTLRLLVAERDDRGGWSTLEDRTVITRLSGGFDPGARLLSAASMDRTLAVLSEFAAVIRARGAVRALAAATGICRKAANGPAFIERVRTETGLATRILSGEAEAGLALDGALFRLGPDFGPFVFLDIGGSSTEISISDGPRRVLQSLNLGSVELTERLVKSDPPTDEDLSRLWREAATRVGEGFAFLRAHVPSLPPRLVGTAGTVTTVVALCLALDPYDPARVEGYRLSIGEIADRLARLLPLTVAERRGVRGMPAGREDVIVAGMVVILAVMEEGGYREMTVTEGSLREGLLLRAAAPGPTAWAP